MLYPGQAGLIRFIKYPGLTMILHRIMSIDNPDESGELNILDGDDGIMYPDSFQD